MPERKLDEDDVNWVLANHGRGTSKRVRSPGEPEVDTDAAEQSRLDTIAAFRRMGREPPASLLRVDTDEDTDDESPDAWRDDWREVRGKWTIRHNPEGHRLNRMNPFDPPGPRSGDESR